jgi:hypothetical protein
MLKKGISVQIAPERPTSIELNQAHPLTGEGQLLVAQNRYATAQVLCGERAGTVNFIGACGLDKNHFDITAREGAELAASADPEHGDVRGQRQCFWKPRTDPASWWGEETTAPEATHAFVVEQANLYGHGVAEIGHIEHAKRYGHLLMLGWFGGRNMDLEMKKRVALMHPDLPLANKNPLGGDIEATLEEVRILNELRGPDAAPVVLMYRGGENAQTPKIWEKQFIRAYEATGGLFIVDLAHGAEMAHDPAEQFSKSEEGQLRSTQHAIELAKSGYAAAGYATEMSDAPSRVDPPVPFNLSAADTLYRARLAQLQP